MSESYEMTNEEAILALAAGFDAFAKVLRSFVRQPVSNRTEDDLISRARRIHRLGPLQVRIIACLGLSELGLTRRELATELNVAYASVVQAVNALVVHGLITKSRDELDDGSGESPYVYNLASILTDKEEKDASYVS